MPEISVLELRLTVTVTTSPSVTFVLLAPAVTDADAAPATTEQVKITQNARSTEISDLIFFIITAYTFFR